MSKGGFMEFGRMVRMTPEGREAVLAELNTASSFTLTAIQVDDGSVSPHVRLQGVRDLFSDRPFPKEANVAEQARVERETIVEFMNYCNGNRSDPDPLATCLGTLNKRLMGMMTAR